MSDSASDAAAPGTITSLLAEARSGNQKSADQLWSRVYDDLRRIASRQLRGQPGGALNPTLLVNHACERLLERQALDADNRRHLYFVMSRAIHDALVELARKDLAQKRGGGRRNGTLVEITADHGRQQFELLDLNAALEALGRHDVDAANIVKLRFYAGLSLEEAAAAAGCTFAVARRHWEYARAWLHERLAR